jgi:hypothetical protein
MLQNVITIIRVRYHAYLKNVLCIYLPKFLFVTCIAHKTLKFYVGLYKTLLMFLGKSNKY